MLCHQDEIEAFQKKRHHIKPPNNKTISFKKIFVFLLVSLLSTPPEPCLSEQTSIAVVMSQKIRPYIQILKGFEHEFSENLSHNIEIFTLLPSINRPNHEKIRQTLIKKRYDIFLAIGPEAGELLWAINPQQNRYNFFSAVLNPQKFIQGSFACGVSLKIPVQIQLKKIKESLPGVKSIGLLFDPKQNQLFLEDAISSSKENGLTLVPLMAKSKKEIPRILKRKLNRVDCIWMIPDKTIISEKIVQYVIKQALYQKKGVIGYNAYFIKSGAVFAFEFDYTEIGKQTANKIITYLRTGICSNAPPFFHVKINNKMIQTLGMETGEAGK